MQRTESIKSENLPQIINTIFSIGDVNVFESYSEMEKDLIQINNADEFKDYVREAVKNENRLLDFALYYPESKGFYQIVKIALNPKYCDGKTFRYRIDGWGIIHFHIDLRELSSEIECRFAVNSEKRARNGKVRILR